MSTPSVEIFIKSYPPDFDRLSYCLRSLTKFARGFVRTVLAVPPGHGLHLTQEAIVEIPEQTPGYLFQQTVKLNADLHIHRADFIWYIDSDCVLTRETRPDEFLVDGKPRWMMTPWKDCFESKKIWYHIMAKCVQECPQHEFMRRHGIMIPRWALAAFREFIQKTHGMTMDAYVMNQPGHEFSEFNCIGFWLWCFHRDKIHWHDTSVDGIPDDPIEQSWSWAEEGITQEYRNRMEILLA